MTFKRNAKTLRPVSLIAATLLLGWASLSQAHGRYVVPSHTLVSGDKPQSISLTASISNDMFHPDKPLGNEAGGKVNSFLQSLFETLNSGVVQPDGSIQPMQWQAYQRFSASDLTLKQSGTYRVQLVQPETHMVTFKNAKGERDRRFGKETQLPDGATSITHRTIASNVVVYISHNEISDVPTTGKGLELAGNTHPNDLFAGEEASFAITFNGKPLTSAAKLHLVKGGTRYRNQRNDVELQTSDTGEFTLLLKEPGMYWLEVEYSRKGGHNSGVDVHHNTLYLTLEVFPE